MGLSIAPTSSDTQFFFVFRRRLFHASVKRVEKEKQEPDQKLLHCQIFPAVRQLSLSTDILLFLLFFRFFVIYFSSFLLHSKITPGKHISTSFILFWVRLHPSDRSQSQSSKISKAVGVPFPSHKILPLSEYLSSLLPFNRVQKALALPNFIQQSTSHDS
jgi:hypothetical protein